MSTITISSRRTRWLVALTVLALIGALVLGACTTPTSVPPTTTLSAPSAPATVKTIADDIAAEVGQVTQVVEGDSNRIIIIFEETHVSRAGQIEIAIMLNRLYEDYDLRLIGLEGAFTTDGALDAEWFHFPPPFRARAPIRTREDVIAQLLQEGEINSSEMMALIYTDLTVSGIDDADKYPYEPPDEAWSADTWYLLQIAVQGMTRREIEECDKLIDDDIEKAIECYIYSDEWAGEKYDLFNDPTTIISCERYIQILEEIEAKAAEVNADIKPEDEENLQALKRFFELSSIHGGRAAMMATATLSLLEQSPNAPVVMTIGAAHTEGITQLLAKEGVSFAVIRGNSLADAAQNGDLHYQAYERKMHSQSVDPEGEFGLVGALLENRKKPPPVIDEETWLRSKASIYLLADHLAHAVKAGEASPFTDVLNELPPLEGVWLDQSSIEVEGDEVIFSVRALDSDGEETTIWICARTDREKAMLLEERLFEALHQVQSMDEPNNAEPEHEPSQPVRITYDTVVWTAGTREKLATVRER